MFQMYTKALRYFRQVAPALLLFSALIEALLRALPAKHATGGLLVAFTILAYYFHRYFLYGENDLTLTLRVKPGARPVKFGRFLLVTLAMFLLPIIAGAALALKLAALNTPKDAAVLILLMVVAPLYLVILSLFGTALPGAVDRDARYRLSLGLKASPKTLWRLLQGPVLTYAVILGVVFVLGATGLWRVWPENTLADAALSVLARFIGFFGTIIAVVALCDAYREIVPEAESA